METPENKEALELITRLLSSVRHDLRNPLGVMSNSLYFLDMKLPEKDGKVKEHLDLLQREVDRLNTIIGRMFGCSQEDIAKIFEPLLSNTKGSDHLLNVVQNILARYDTCLEGEKGKGLPRKDCIHGKS